MPDSDIHTLITLFSKLPGLGPRSARRTVLKLVRHKEQLMLPLAQALQEAAATIRTCSTCGNLDTVDPCAICSDPKRNPALICVIEDLADLWAIERSGMFRGRYHILGGTLSAMDGVGPDTLRIPKLVERAHAPEVEEVIIATNATVDGQTTAHYITDSLQETGVRTSRPAQGIPIGGELDYLDDGTLGTALKARTAFYSNLNK